MKKCKWGRDQVAFFGHIITPSGILPNPEKVKAVMNVARPPDLHTVRAFLGLTSYFRRYIPGYDAISAPIERLKAISVEFVWIDDCEAAFLQLKRRLVEPPILVYPDFSKRFKLYVDSSHLAVGACLMQTVDGRERVVAYASKLLVGSERNWINKQDGTSEIECWEIVWVTCKFRCYLDRNEFDLYTDHKALTWVFNEGNRTSNAKLARWAMELSQLRFKVYHKPGTAVGHVDGLSRLYSQTICALSMADLLNEDSEPGDDGLGAVGEGPDSVPLPRTRLSRHPKPSRVLDEALRTAREALDAVGEPPAPQVPDETRAVVAGDAGGEPVEAGPEPDAVAEPDDEEFDYEDEVVSERPATSSVDVFGLDRERFVEEQKRTPWIQAVIAFLECGALALDPQLRAKVLLISPHYVVRNGMLMRRVHLKARAGHARSIAVPVIPLPFVETVLHYCHAGVFAAHVGQSKTMDKARKHAYWHGRKRDVAECVRACTVCGSGKGYRPWRNGLMQRMPVQDLSGPFSLLVVDAIGPLVTTPRGNKYILVFADYFTRWVEAFPVEALDTITFVNIMIDEVLSRHGVPERLLSDRGSNFISELAKSFYETLGIKKRFGGAYHPQTQGLVERFNGTLIGMLRMFVSEAQSDWDLYLPRVLFAYRTSYHKALGDSSFFSLYGRDPVVPLDLAFLNTRNEWRSNEVAEYADGFAVEFQEGDAVLVYQYFRARRGEKRTKKLAFSWHGPYRIVGKLGDNIYKVAIPNHPDRVVPVNVNRLKKIEGRWGRPFPKEVPAGVKHQPGADDAGPLTEEDLPSTSFVERLLLGGEETAFSGVTTPIVAIIGKRMKGRQEQYMVFTASYETCWRPTTSLLPEFAPLIKAYEDEQRSAKGWPELRRSVQLSDANAIADEDELLF
ncbi:Retrovirus-related Pol Polyprotein [Phytophthora cinnamomi]|uniref:Retrovirus-related Pol Polyprotein n=1 Tax=Phytophthora cinnamomi TaxID=4785 RepID=UPI003559853B|nr:Retrovirus-related Pol Polyprotein [Phytophthora cinnamomi]